MKDKKRNFQFNLEIIFLAFVDCCVVVEKSSVVESIPKKTFDNPSRCNLFSRQRVNTKVVK